MRADIDFPHRRAGHCGSGAFRDLLEFHGLTWTGEPLSEGAGDHAAGREHVDAIARLERGGVAALVPG